MARGFFSYCQTVLRPMPMRIPMGALPSTLLFSFGSSLVTVFVHHKKIGDLYAGASAVVLALVWVYYSAQVFFFGACIAVVLRERTSGETRGS